MEVKYDEIIRIINEDKSVASNVNVSANFANTVTLLIEQSRAQLNSQVDRSEKLDLESESES